MWLNRLSKKQHQKVTHTQNNKKTQKLTTPLNNNNNKKNTKRNIPFCWIEVLVNGNLHIVKPKFSIGEQQTLKHQTASADLFMTDRSWLSG